MSQNKEEYEVGIPLDDLMSRDATPDGDDDALEEEADAAAHERPPDEASGNDENGLPSLFDEEELAEVGLEASPFGDEIDPPEETDASEPPSETPVDTPDEPIDLSVAEGFGDASDLEASIDEPDVREEEAASLKAFAEDVESLEPADPPSALEDADFDSAEAEMAGVLDGQDAPAAPSELTSLEDRLQAIQTQLAQLQDEFVGKLKYDSHKDHIIDKLHQELQEYKQDIVKKHILSIVLDVVKVADDIRKWLAYFRSLDVSQRDPVKLFRYLEAIPSDLEDVFYWQGVKPYTSQEDTFNPATQRAIKKVPTSDNAKDKTIAKRIRPGYEWEGKVIRQEMVAVYVYEDGKESVETGNIDE